MDCALMYMYIHVVAYYICMFKALVCCKRCGWPLKVTGDTVLHIACRKKDHDLVKLFIENAADVNIQNVKFISFHCQSFLGYVCSVFT